MSKSNELAEDRLIARYFRPLATAAGAFGLIDDAAALTPPPGCDLVLTTDGVIAGVHFFPDDPPEMVSRKVLRMNLSDLAAKGARPLGFLLSVALPEGFGEAWLGAFAAGLADDAAHYGCPLYGGDTDHTPGPISVSIFAFGAVPQGKMVHRSTARPGDRIVVTGTIGDAAIGLQLRRELTLARRWGLSDAAAAQLENRYLLPQPRNALADASCNTHRRRSTFPMDLPAISASSAARRRWRPTSMSQPYRSRTPRAQRSRPSRRSWRPRSPAATTMRSC